MFLGVPDIKSYLSQKDSLSWRYIAKEHLFYFSGDSLKKLLETEGFKILEIKKDHTNLSAQSIRQLLRYLIGRPIVRDRFKDKSFAGRVEVPKPNWFKRFLKMMIIRLIKIIKREDFILLVACRV